MNLRTACLPAFASTVAILFASVGCAPREGGPEGITEPARRPAFQPLSGQPAAPPEPKVVIDLTPKPSTVATAEKTPAGPRLLYPDLSNRDYFAKLNKDLADGFQKAIAAHKQAKSAPIRTLGRLCKTGAEELGRRPWGIAQVDMDSYIAHLKQASDAITEELKDKEYRWRAADGIDGPARSTVLELDQVQWLEDWQKLILTEFAGRVAKKLGN